MTTGPESRPLYDRIGVGYDATRRADPYLTERLVALLDIRSNGAYLDVASGTGNYTTALSRRGGRWTGLDRSGTMVAAARAKGGAVRWLAGDAARLPFRDDAFDGALCTLALHHLGDVRGPFGEVRRVLRGGGAFAIFTSDPEQMAAYWLHRYFPTMMRRAMDRMPPIGRVRGALLDAGFARVDVEPYAVRPDLADLFLFAGKHRPELYLDPRVRAGISAFAGLAEPAELAAGLARLSADIDSGAIRAIIAGADASRGDYYLVRAAAA